MYRGVLSSAWGVLKQSPMLLFQGWVVVWQLVEIKNLSNSLLECKFPSNECPIVACQCEHINRLLLSKPSGNHFPLKDQISMMVLNSLGICERGIIFHAPSFGEHWLWLALLWWIDFYLLVLACHKRYVFCVFFSRWKAVMGKRVDCAIKIEFKLIHGSVYSIKAGTGNFDAWINWLWYHWWAKEYCQDWEESFLHVGNAGWAL